MNTGESFDFPGAESPEQVIEKLPSIPRQITITGQQTDIIARIVLYVLGLGLASHLISLLIEQFASSISFAAWCAILVLLPLVVFVLPWLLCISFIRHKRSITACRSIYENGLPTTGTIVMMSYISGHDYACYFSEKAFHPSAFARRVRIDYSFMVNNEIITGFVFLHEKSIKYLSVNREICILYNPADPYKNMIFPIPGEEMCSGCLK